MAPARSEAQRIAMRLREDVACDRTQPCNDHEAAVSKRDAERIAALLLAGERVAEALALQEGQCPFATPCQGERLERLCSACQVRVALAAYREASNG